MSDDLKQRLRAKGGPICEEAVLRIEALERQVEDLQFRLDAALKEYVDRAVKENQHG